MATSDAASPRTLNGWKEIASYLNKSVRSVQRWEATLALPVRRIKTPAGQIVYAEADEIDAWRAGLDVATKTAVVEEPGPGPHLDPPLSEESERWLARPRPWLQAVIALALFATGASWQHWRENRAGAPLTFNLTARALEALRPDGSVMWVHRFDRDVTSLTNRGRRFESWQVDLDDDHQPEVLAFVRFAQPGRPGMGSDGLFCFGRDGSLKWSVLPDQTIAFGEQVFAAPWVIEDVAVANTVNRRRIWLALAHQTWWPGLVLEVDGRDGTTTIRYIQAGRIFSIAHWMTPSGGVLGVGGTSRDSSLATLALLPDADPASSFDASTQAAAHCDQCAARKPRRVFAFEDVELSRLFTHRHPFVNNLVVSGTDLKASINLRLTPGGGQMIALIGPDQRIKSLSFADSYWRAHDELHQSGDIDHGAAECPERGVPLVARAWTSAGGWHDVTANPEPASQ